jgi:histidinol-phosphatase (PHP family)
LNVLVGCETENITSPGTLDYLTHILGSDANTAPEKVGKGTVDYIVGSLHHSHAIPIDFDRKTFERSVESFASAAAHGDKRQAHLELVNTYLDDQLEVLERLRPEVVGHFDLFRLFEPELKLEKPQLWAKVERNVRFAVAYGALFECNAAAFRKGWSSAYPAPDILQLILKLGGRLCLSDDSHGVHAVGLNYARLRQYLIDQGVDTLWYLEKDSEETAPAQNGPPVRFARGTVAKSMGPEWQSHPFWSHFTATLESESQP